MNDMSDTHKTIIACVAFICVMMTITITSANVTRDPKTDAQKFIETCAWGGGTGASVQCADIYARANGGSKP